MTDKNYDGTPTEVSFGIGYCAMRLAMTRSIYEENLVKNELSKNKEFRFVVTEVGGSTKKDFQEKVTRSILGAR